MKKGGKYRRLLLFVMKIAMRVFIYYLVDTNELNSICIPKMIVKLDTNINIKLDE